MSLNSTKAARPAVAPHVSKGPGIGGHCEPRCRRGEAISCLQSGATSLSPSGLPRFPRGAREPRNDSPPNDRARQRRARTARVRTRPRPGQGGPGDRRARRSRPAFRWVLASAVIASPAAGGAKQSRADRPERQTCRPRDCHGSLAPLGNLAMTAPRATTAPARQRPGHARPAVAACVPMGPSIGGHCEPRCRRGEAISCLPSGAADLSPSGLPRFPRGAREPRNDSPPDSDRAPGSSTAHRSRVLACLRGACAPRELLLALPRNDRAAGGRGPRSDGSWHRRSLRAPLQAGRSNPEVPARSMGHAVGDEIASPTATRARYARSGQALSRRRRASSQ